MSRFRLPLLAALYLFTVTACTPVKNIPIGSPEAPYPLPNPPRVGDIVHLPTGTTVDEAHMVAVAGDARIVYVGETHDNPASHRLELVLLRSLARLHPGRQALGMEMFSRSQQPVLDRWIAGELDEKAFLKQVRWFDTWRMDFDYYRDLLNFARDNHIPVIALNADKKMVESVRTAPAEQLTREEQEQLPELDLNDPYQRAMVKAIFGDHNHGKLGLDGFIRAQTLWDETMAESVARYLQSPAGKDKHLLVVAGGNHVSYGFGIPRRAFRRLPASYVMIGGKEIDIPADKKDRLMDVDMPEFPMAPYDFLAYLRYEDLPRTGVFLGVMFEAAPAGNGLTVKKVVPGSNADRAGLKPGDLLTAMDGESLEDSFDLTYAVKRKQPGDRSRISVIRQSQPLEVDVEFQSTGKEHHKR